MDNEKIGKFIALRRKELGLTQKQLALKLHVTDKAISKWETGMGCPDVSILGELSEILEVGIGEILNGEYDNNLKDNSKFIMDAVNYSKKATTKRIYEKISIILISIISICCLYMLILGIYQTMYFNQITTYTVDKNILEELKNVSNEVIQKYNFISNSKTNILSERENETLAFILKMYNKEYFDKVASRYFKEEYILKPTDLKILYYDSNNMLGIGNVFMGLGNSNSDIDKIFRNFNSLIYKKNELYTSGEYMYQDMKLYDYTEYEYSNIYNQPNFGDIHIHLLIHFQEINILLENLIKVGEFHE